MSQRSGDTIWHVLEYLPVGVCIVDSDYTVHFWNSSMEQWTGKKRDEITGTDLRSHFPRINKSGFQDRLKSIFTGNSPVVFSSQLHAYIFDAPLADGSMRRQIRRTDPEIQHGFPLALHLCDFAKFPGKVVFRDGVEALSRFYHCGRRRLPVCGCR